MDHAVLPATVALTVGVQYGVKRCINVFLECIFLFVLPETFVVVCRLVIKRAQKTNHRKYEPEFYTIRCTLVMYVNGHA